MAEFGVPVAQEVNVNPNQGLTTLSNLLSIKQQKLALETGQALKSSAESEAVTRGVEAKGHSEAAGFLKNFDIAKHIAPDGTVDLDAVYNSPDFQNAGPGKELIANTMLGIKQHQIQNKQEMATLKGTVVTGAGKLLGSLVSDPDVVAGNDKGKAKIQSQIDIIKEMYPDQGAAFIDKFEKGLNSDHVQPKDWQWGLRAMQLQAEDVSQQQAQQNPVLGTAVSPQGQQVGTAQNRITGDIQTAGGGVPLGLSPTERIGYVGARAAAAAAGGGAAATDVERANDIGKAANSAPDAIRLSQEIDALADQVHSGKISKAFSSAAAAAGIDPVTYSRQLLNKDLGQLKALASSNAGSDQRMATILSGYPEDSSATPTIHTAMDYIRGSFRKSLARGANLETYNKKHGGDLSGFQHSDNVLSQHTDPLMHEYLSLKPEERAGFYRRNFTSPQAAQDFKNKVKGISHATGQ